MIFSPHKNFIIAVCLFVPDPELHSGTERSSFFDKFRIPGPEPSVLSVNLAGSGPVMVFIDNHCSALITSHTPWGILICAELRISRCVQNVQANKKTLLTFDEMK